MVVFSTLLWLISSHTASVPRIFECSQYFHLQCGLFHNVHLHLASSSVDSSRFVQRFVQQLVLEMATLSTGRFFLSLYPNWVLHSKVFSQSWSATVHCCLRRL